jgi:hypothetical protein
MDFFSLTEHMNYCNGLLPTAVLHTHVRYTRGSQVVTTVQSVQASERLRECVRQSSLLLPLREHLYYLKSHWNF